MAQLDYVGTSTTASVAALVGTIYWFDSGTDNDGENVYYDELSAYALWHDTANWYISVVADVGTTTNTFKSASDAINGVTFTGQGTLTGTIAMASCDYCRSLWEWSTVNRNRDYSYVRNDEFYRENWSLSRFRYSTTPYQSELGDTEDTGLSGYNAGVTEPIAPPTFESLAFQNNFATGTWANTSYTNSLTNAASGPLLTTMVGVEFYRANWKYLGKPVYVSTTPSIQSDATWGNEVYIVFWEDDAYDSGTLGGSGKSYWHFASVPETFAESGDVGSLGYASILLWAEAKTERYGIGWISGGAPSGEDPSLTDYVEFDAATIDFRCTSDMQGYDSRGVEWYRQTQTWIAKTPWN